MIDGALPSWPAFALISQKLSKPREATPASFLLQSAAAVLPSHDLVTNAFFFFHHSWDKQHPNNKYCCCCLRFIALFLTLPIKWLIWPLMRPGKERTADFLQQDTLPFSWLVYPTSRAAWGPVSVTCISNLISIPQACAEWCCLQNPRHCRGRHPCRADWFCNIFNLLFVPVT